MIPSSLFLNLTFGAAVASRYCSINGNVWSLYSMAVLDCIHRCMNLGLSGFRTANFPQAMKQEMKEQ